MNFVQLNTSLAGDQADWTFVGDPNWRQDHTGIIYPPVWSYPHFDPDPTQIPMFYAHELAREDFAFLTSQALDDVDVSVDFKCPYGSVLHGGIVFRALDSSRCYVLAIIDRGGKGMCYELSLWLQDATGYRKELAWATALHSMIPGRIAERGTRTREEWDHSSPDWVTVRVQAAGSFIRVSVDAQVLFQVRDRTYPVGCVGLHAIGSVYFRNLRVGGTAGELPGPWTRHEGELPRFFLPGGEQPEGFNAYPAACHTEGGLTLAAWAHAPGKLGDAWPPTSVIMTRSEDEGKTWSRPECICARADDSRYPVSIFGHRDGALTCLVGINDGGTVLVRSSDGGRSWSEPEDLVVGGRSFSTYSEVYPYSPMTRLSDGRVVMCAYEAKTMPEGDPGHNVDRLDRSLFLVSSDDGYTWSEPIYFDPDNFDHNECMVAEVEPGRLVAFMRTLAAPHMWTSRSEDGGNTWSPLAQSDVSCDCPYLLRHSSGTLVLGGRGAGTFLKLSFDQGRSWTTTCRMSSAGSMMAMVEMSDGRVLNVMHEGYRVPSVIRAQYFRVTPDGPVAAE